MNRSANTFNLTDKDLQVLLWYLAPVFYIKTAGTHNIPARVMWNKQTVDVDTSKPTVYYYITHALFKGKPALQINYVIWFQGRFGPNSPPIERGHIDGITVRLSIDSAGRIIMLDLMNNCGCYHVFVPPQKRIHQQIPQPNKPDGFVYHWLPETNNPTKFGLILLTDWHQLLKVTDRDLSVQKITYALLPYTLLESLPHKNGQHESIFDSRGIVKGSDRIERFLFFSMGIPKIGSMRQRGHHAIELIGRSHFDDPYLLEQHFTFRY